MHINHILMSSLLAKGCKFEPILTLLAFQALNNEGPLWYGPSVYKIAPWTHDIHTCWRARCWYRNYFYVAARIQCLTIHKRGETSTKFAAACITNTYSLNRTFPARIPILTPQTPLTPPKPAGNDEDIGFSIKWSRVFFKLHWKLILLCVNLYRMKYTKVKIFVKHLLCNLSDLKSWLFVIYLCLRLNNCKCSKLIITCVVFICK